MKRVFKALTKASFFSLPVILLGFSRNAFAAPFFELTGLAITTNPNEEVLLIILYLLRISFDLAVFGIIAGAFIYIVGSTSITGEGDNKKKTKQGKDIITNSILGLVIILLAYAIISTVNTVFNVK